jgi:uncharacterized membrane protein
LRYRTVSITLAIILLASSLPTAACQGYYTPRELSFIVYSDGYTAVEYRGDVDPTRSRVNVSLFGSLYLDILVEDQDGLPLDHRQLDGGISVDTLGSISVLVSYVTQDLTGKAGQIWTFSVSVPMPAVVVLPEDSTIVSLSSVPLAVSDIDGTLIFTMPEGEIEVSYTIGVVGTREHALAVIKDAEETIQTIKDSGIITEEADTLLQQANDALSSGLYSEAEQLADDAKASAQEASSQAATAESKMTLAREAISAAEDAGNTVGLDQARDLLREAETAFEAGGYQEAGSLAQQAQTVAAEATQEGGFPMLWVGGAVVVSIVVILAYLFIRRGSERVSAETVSFDLDRLFEDHPHMRLDDKEVLRFIAESGGEVFAAEIRERFDAPRTSLWRMIRRLEREGAAEVEMVGGQSLVKINGKYRGGGPEG